MTDSLALLAAEIRKRRTALGWSQEELAERCNFDRTYISMLERGRRNPSLRNLEKLARGLSTSVASLTSSLDRRV
ncbi:MAG TPA: XRE family transcriptional regulator [Acetobacteraceae bacterium]|nr:XRE family transcriptional regulator [Acetobacteraceae bacterium]